MNSVEDAPLGLLSFLSFGFSIITAVLAIDMYRLLRTGEFGKTWRVLIIASVMLALLQVLRVADILNFHAVREEQLSQIVELCFIMSLAYSFYIQRKLFDHEHKHSASEEEDNLELPIAQDDDEDSDGNETEDVLLDQDDADVHDAAAPKTWADYQSADISRPNSCDQS